MDGSCRCQEIASIRISRATVLCSDGDYSVKVKENFVKSFILHGVTDDCKNGIKIAMKRLLKTKVNTKC